MFASQHTDPNYYYLSASGRKKLLDTLYLMTQVHPDIQFCPLLPPITALFLHVMDEDSCYCCLASMLDETRGSFLDQSQRAVAVRAKTFQDCLKLFMVSVAQFFKIFRCISKVRITIYFFLLEKCISSVKDGGVFIK